MDLLLPRPPETFLGRDDELERLSNLLSHRHLFLVKGIAGIGKTSLVLALLHRRPGQRGLYLRCLPGWGLEDLAAALEGLTESEAGTAPGRERLLHLIRAFNQNDRLVVLDDVHHIRPRELETLVRLLQTYLTARFLLVSREDLPVPPLDRVDILEHHLEELPPAIALTLLERLLSLHAEVSRPRSELSQLATATGGHPLLLKLLASLILSRRLVPGKLSEPPAVVRDYLVGEVLGQVSPEEREALELLALSPVALAPELVGAALEPLERRFVVQRDDQGNVLLHQLLAAPLAAGLSPEQRRERCLRLAAHCEVEHAFDLLLAAGQPERARALLEQAAAGLCSRGQYLFLIGALERLDPPYSNALAVMQANALCCLGRWEEAEQVLLPRADAAARVSLASVCLNTGRWNEALALYAGALEQLEERTERLKCLNYAALLQAFRGELEPARSTVSGSFELVRDPADRAHALRIAATVEALAGDFESAHRQGQESVDLAHQLNMPRLAGLARFPLGLALLGLGRRAQAVAVFEEALREARLRGETHLLAWSSLGLGLAQQSPEMFLEAARQFQAHGNRLGQAMAEVCAACDEPEALRRAAEQAHRLGNPWLEAEARLALDEIPRNPVWLLAPLRAALPAEPVVRLRVQCLGPLRLMAGRQVVSESDWPTRKALRLFARLCHRRGAAYSDLALMESLWPEAEPNRARGNLRHALHQIRTILRPLGVEGEVILRRRKAGTLELQLDASLDVEDFETTLMTAASRLEDARQAADLLGSALALYQGDFLVGLDEPWAEGPRAHYLELRLRAQHQLARCRLSLEQPREAEQAARAGLEQDDLREELHVDLIEALAQQHRKAEALRHYRDTLAHFEQELGLVPRSFEAVYPLLITP